MTTSQRTISSSNQTGAAARNKQKATSTTVLHTTQSGTGGSTTESAGNNGHPVTAIPQAEPAHRSFSSPAWPTSQPGPMVTPPPLGQHPHPLRTDQMVYECYDQERGIPCVLPASSTIQKEPRDKTSRPDISSEDTQAETEAVARWQDDGGFPDREEPSQASPLPVQP